MLHSQYKSYYKMNAKVNYPKQIIKSHLNLDYLLKVINMKTKLQVILYKYVRVNKFLNRAYIVHQAMEKDILLKIKNFF